MLPEPATLVPFTLAVIVIALTPGPDMTFFVSRALIAGRPAGIAAVAGAATGLVIHSLLVALGISALIVAAPTAFLALKVAGALYLLLLAYQMIRHGTALNVERGRGRSASLASTWASGVAINLLNPKVALFFLTFLPQFVDAGDPEAVSRLFGLGAIFVLIGSAINLVIVLVANRFATGMQRNPRVARTIDWLCAGIFTAFAAQLLLSRAR